MLFSVYASAHVPSVISRERPHEGLPALPLWPLLTQGRRPIDISYTVLNFTQTLCSWKTVKVKNPSPHPYPIFCILENGLLQRTILTFLHDLDKTHRHSLCLPMTTLDTDTPNSLSLPHKWQVSYPHWSVVIKYLLTKLPLNLSAGSQPTPHAWWHRLRG